MVAGREGARTFGGNSYIELTGKPFDGWWVRAFSLDFETAGKLAQGTRVRLSSGDHRGLRIYGSGEVRTRRAVRLANAASFSASRRMTFEGRTFLFLTDGPLANRWVVQSYRVRVINPDKDGDATSPSQPMATWKGLVLIYRDTDVTFTRPNGTEYRLQAHMGAAMHELVLDTLDDFANSVGNWSDGTAALDLEVVEVPHKLTNLNEFGSGYWVGPQAVERDIDSYAPHGTYDSVLVIWQPKDDAGVQVPVPGWGLTLGPGPWANGAGFSSITTPGEMWWWTGSDVPEEVFVHEWMHQVIFWNEAHDRLELDLHAGGSYGYEAAGGTWKRWLADVMTGAVRDGDRHIGIKPEMWSADQPTRPYGRVLKKPLSSHMSASAPSSLRPPNSR